MGFPPQESLREIREGKVYNRLGEEVTANFTKGAAETLKLAKFFGCQAAVLKERSPSCGCGVIYDGSFSGKKIPGDGITAALLKRHGIQVIGESKIEFWQIKDGRKRHAKGFDYKKQKLPGI